MTGFYIALFQSTPPAEARGDPEQPHPVKALPFLN